MVASRKREEDSSLDLVLQDVARLNLLSFDVLRFRPSASAPANLETFLFTSDAGSGTREDSGCADATSA